MKYYTIEQLEHCMHYAMGYGAGIMLKTKERPSLEERKRAIDKWIDNMIPTELPKESKLKVSAQVKRRKYEKRT